MRIGIDMLAVQSAGRARGTGRYTRALATALLRDTTHEWILYYHDDLQNVSGDSVGNALRGVPWRDDGGPIGLSRNATEGVPYRIGEAGDVPLASAQVTEHVLPARANLHASVEELLHANADKLDVLLLSCPLENFQGYLPPFPRRNGPKLAAIVYDLIPLRFPQHYLRHPGIAAGYRRALAALRQYDLLLTISDSGRQDVLRCLSVSPERVTTIGAGSDAAFFYPPTSLSSGADAGRWLSQRHINQPYVYALTAIDYRKNLSGLLSAIERLPARLLDEHQFVITCAASNDDDARQARAAIERASAASRIALTGALADTELRTLYQHAAAFVFPSRYEGFGLPLVEAMQCGAPVIGGNNSSQIEVVGDAGLLVDVDDAGALAAKIEQVLTDRQLAASLRGRGIERARGFAWPAVADRCRKALEATVGRPRRSTWLGTLTARGKLAVESRVDRYVPRLRRASA